MFKTLRWRLTIWFVLLSLLVYSALAGLVITFFYAGLTRAMDGELQDLSEELVADVDCEEGKLELRQWPMETQRQHQHHSRRSPIKVLAAIQLFDPNGRLVQEYGLKGIASLMKGSREISSAEYSKRSLSTPLYTMDGKLAGYLQIQLTTRLRDNAVGQLGITMGIIGPILLLLLGVSGYFFAGKAARPIEETFAVLRQFLSDAGHELGTPLAIVQAATENLAAQLEDTPHAARLAIISRTTDRMSRLVQDLTYLAKADVRQQQQQLTNVSMDQLAQHCIEEFQDRYREKNVDLSAAEINTATVYGDQDALHRVLTNLLENALRYTDGGGKVKVGIKTSGRLMRLTVDDTGIGIPNESLPHLFERFYRVDRSRSRAKGGFGLGLAIVKVIVEQHRGYVEVSSEEGKGSQFSLLIPVSMTSSVLRK